MKKYFIAAVLTALCGMSARADESSALTKSTSSTGSADNYAGTLGAGLIVGEPTGGSIKYWFNDTLAIDGAVGWSTHNHTDLYVHSDVLWHNFDVFPVSKGRLPLYFGVGGLLRFRDDNKDNQVGVRVPVDVVLRARGKDRDPEDRVLGADGRAREQPAHVHVDPAVLGAEGGVARRGVEALLHRVLADAADRWHSAPPVARRIRGSYDHRR